MSDIEIGLWQSKFDGKYIKVRSAGLTVVRYSDEGSSSVYDMGVSQLLSNYQLREADSDEDIEVGSVWFDSNNRERIKVTSVQGEHVFYQIAAIVGGAIFSMTRDVFNANCVSLDKEREYIDGYLSSLKPEIRADIELDSALKVAKQKRLEQKPKHSHYHKDVSDLDTIDIYAICDLYVDDKSGCIQHAVKKLLCCGKRGAKNELKDLQEAIDTIQRKIEIEQRKT